MRFFSLSLRQLSMLSIILIACLVFILINSFINTSWTTLFHDRTNSEILEIETINVFPTIPATEADLKFILSGELPPYSYPIQVQNYWKNRFNGEQIPKMSEQMQGVSESNIPEDGYAGKLLLYYVDIDLTKSQNIKNPNLFFFSLTGQWEVFINNQKVSNGNFVNRFLKIPIPENIGKQFRITWAVKNQYNERMGGFMFNNGISIRSEEEAAWAQRTLPIQFELPRLIASIFFLCFAIFSLVLAFSIPRYTDLWAFAAFCGTMFYVIWSGSIFFWESFDFTSGRSNFFSSIRIAGHGLIVLTAACLSLSFFRIKNLKLWVAFFCTFTWVFNGVFSSWPYTNSNIASYMLYLKADAILVKALITSQIIIFALGFFELWSTAKEFKNDGLTAMLPPMRRRLWEAVLFCVAATIMLYAFSAEFATSASTPGSDVFFLFALIPASVIFIQFYWMMGASQRFREKLLPQLDYVDYLTLELGDEAVSKTYQGVLASFDLMGFKKITSLKAKGPKYITGINTFMDKVQKSISKAVIRDRTVFRYKSNGDEWIWAIYAKDESEAQEILTAVTMSWRKYATQLLQYWKSTLRTLLDTEDPKVLEAIASLDIHVMFCKMNDLTIKTEEGKSRPDFTSDSFTHLTEAFKASTHLCVAMYQHDAEAVMLASKTSGRFVSFKKDLGYLTWEDTSEAPLESVA